jgi:hypothetical protein
MKGSILMKKRLFALVLCMAVGLGIAGCGAHGQEGTPAQEKDGQLSSMVTKTKSGTAVETEYASFDHGSFLLKVPVDFTEWDHETILKKYSGDVPDVVFSNHETTVNLAVSFTENRMDNGEIKGFQAAMVAMLKENGEILSTDYNEVDQHNVGQIKLISQGLDTGIYNHMIFFSHNHALVIVTFNCTAALQEEWQDVGAFLLDSLSFEE